jgi:glyoxylase-like metal-dependent hydrolase (beta-lactamase superfamily II)
MRVECLPLGPLDANCWIVADGRGGPAVVIDPGESEPVLAALGNTPVSAVVLTHKHFDHISGVTELVAATGAPLLVHSADAADLGDPHGTGGAQFGFHFTAPEPDRLLEDGDRIEAGGLAFEVLHTPGHTPGGICLFALDPQGAAPHVFVGDTVFAGSVGRTDLEGGDGRALVRSIATKIATLPAETIVHSGHGPDTTIARERKLNMFFPRG